MGKISGRRDILTEILSGAQDDVTDGIEELYQITRFECQQSISSNNNGRSHPFSKNGSKGSKKKTSHYIGPKVFDELTEAKTSIRKLLPSVGKSKVTKSSIVDFAIRAVLREYEAIGPESALVKEILARKAQL